MALLWSWWVCQDQRKGWCEINQGAGLGVAALWLGSVMGGRRGGCLATQLPRPSPESQGALSPHLEVTDVGPEADPAHVLQEHIQGVPSTARHVQCCLPIPVQRPLVLLQPQGQHCCPIPGSHCPSRCQQPASIASWCLLSQNQPRAALCPQRGQVQARGLPHKGSVWLSAPWLSPRPWQGTALLPVDPTAHPEAGWLWPHSLTFCSIT